MVDLGLNFASGIGLSSFDIRTIAASVIRDFLGLMGLYLVVQIMWGGFLMMTHGGSEDARSAATATIKNAVIGMIIIMTASSSTKFVIDAVVKATGFDV
jgi:hypothetical protein